MHGNTIQINPNVKEAHGTYVKAAIQYFKNNDRSELLPKEYTVCEEVEEEINNNSNNNNKNNNIKKMNTMRRKSSWMLQTNHCLTRIQHTKTKTHWIILSPPKHKLAEPTNLKDMK